MGCGTRVGMVPGAVVDGSVEEVWAGYRAYLLSERGVRETTAAGYEADARLFLCVAMGSEGVGLERLTAAEVSGFLVRECEARRVTAAVRLVTVARSVLRRQTRPLPTLRHAPRVPGSAVTMPTDSRTKTPLSRKNPHPLSPTRHNKTLGMRGVR